MKKARPKKARPNPGCMRPECRCSLALTPEDKQVLTSGLDSLKLVEGVATQMSLALRANKIDPVLIEHGIHDSKKLIGEILSRAVPMLEMLNERFQQAQRGELPTEIDLSPEALAVWGKEHAQLMKGANPLLALLVGQQPETQGLPVTGLNPPRLRKGDLDSPDLN